jgi:hypothetical protein
MKLSNFVIALCLAVSPVHAAPSDLPISDPTEDCRQATRPYGIAGFNSCINQEQLYYDLAKGDWLDVSETNRAYCVKLMSKGVARAYYQGLEACLNERLRAQAAETPVEFRR